MFQINLLSLLEIRKFPAHQLENFLLGLEPGLDVEHS